jgi:hypothetical protein
MKGRKPDCKGYRSCAKFMVIPDSNSGYWTHTLNSKHIYEILKSVYIKL